MTSWFERNSTLNVFLHFFVQKSKHSTNRHKNAALKNIFLKKFCKIKMSLMVLIDEIKVRIFWEGPLKIWLHWVASNFKWNFFFKFCGLLRISELYEKIFCSSHGKKLLQILPVSSVLNYQTGTNFLESERTEQFWKPNIF